jgi:hypothetical protein
MKRTLKLINALTLSTKNASSQVLVGILISLAMISSVSAEGIIGESESYIDRAIVPKRAVHTTQTTTLTRTYPAVSKNHSLMFVVAM